MPSSFSASTSAGQAVAVPAEAAVTPPGRASCGTAARRPSRTRSAGGRSAAARWRTAARRRTRTRRRRPPHAGRSTRRTSVPARQRSRTSSSRRGKSGCAATSGYRRSVDGAVMLGSAPALVLLRKDGPSALGGRARGTTLLADRHGVPPLVCAGADGPDPFGSSEDAAAPRSSEGSEVMASSSPLARLYRAAAQRSRGLTAPSWAVGSPSSSNSGRPLPGGVASADRSSLLVATCSALLAARRTVGRSSPLVATLPPGRSSHSSPPGLPGAPRCSSPPW